MTIKIVDELIVSIFIIYCKSVNNLNIKGKIRHLKVTTILYLN